MKWLAMLALAGLAACEVNTTAPVDPTTPSNLGFQLLPSGDPNVPLGIILMWDPPSNGQASAFNVYGRSSGTGWLLRATTSSTTFHDAGIPQAQYYVVGLDQNGNEMGRSTAINVDLSIRLPAPTGLTSTTLNAAIALRWDDNAVHATVAQFDHYRVYSSAYNAAQATCQAPWYFEGSTVSDAFLVGNLTNGVTRCYAVSAISADGHESTWSNARADTPRIDAKSVLVYAVQAKADSAGFVFNDEVAKVFGVVAPSTRADADFTLARQADGSISILPARAGVGLRTFQSTTVPELSAIDRAPLTGYSSSSVSATPGMGYVFQVQEADGTHYGAMRVQFVTADFIVFDWSYQNGVGNPEMSAGRPPM